MSIAGYTDKFIANLIVSWLIACWAVLGVDYFGPQVPWLRQATPGIELAVATVLAACLLLIMPPALTRVLHLRTRLLFRDPSAEKAVWRGRLVGLGFGLLFGIAVHGVLK